MANYSNNSISPVKTIGAIFTIICLVVIAGICLSSFFVVDPGQVAVKLRLGKVVDSYGEGMHWKTPFIENVKKFSIRIKKDIIKTEAFSKDLQTVKVGLAVNHRIQPDTVVAIYRNLGEYYVDTVLAPTTEEWIKAIIAKYSAENLIANRIEVAKEIDAVLKEKMKEKQVIVSDIAIVDFDFTPQFLKAVEEKQIAEQEAKKATNLVEKVKKDAEQQILKAKAEAESLKLQKQVVTPELIKLRQVEAQLKAIEKWDGRMPTYNGGDLPFVMVK